MPGTTPKKRKAKPTCPEGARAIRCGGHAMTEDGKPGKPCEDEAFFFGHSIIGWWCSRHSHQADREAYSLGSGMVRDNR